MTTFRTVRFLLFPILMLTSSSAFSQFGDRQVIQENEVEDANYRFVGAYDFNGDSVEELWYEKREPDNDGVYTQASQIFLQKNGDQYEEVEVNSLTDDGTRVIWFNSKVNDLNGDGLLDLVHVRADTLQVVVNTGNFVFSSPRKIVLDFTIDLFYDYYLRGIDFFLEDFDGDGLDDIVNTKDSVVIWAKNLGDFAFSESKIITEIDERSSCIGLVNLDNNGTNELLVSSYNELEVYKEIAGEYKKAQSVSVSHEGITEILVRDMNQDGYLDILAIEEVYYLEDALIYFENNGSGQLEEAKKIYQNGIIRSIATEDTDSDGDKDVLLSVISDFNFESEFFEGIVQLENIGNQSFTLQPLLPFESGQFFDIDNDQRTDIVLSNNFAWVKFFDYSDKVYQHYYLHESADVRSIRNIDFVRNKGEVELLAKSNEQLHLFRDIQKQPEKMLLRNIWGGGGAALNTGTGLNNVEDIFNGFITDLSPDFDGDQGAIVEVLEYNQSIDSYIFKSDIQLINAYGLEKVLSGFLDEDSISDIVLIDFGNQETSVYQREQKGGLPKKAKTNFYQEVYDLIGRTGNQPAQLLTEEAVYTYDNATLTEISSVGGIRFVDLDGDGDQDIISAEYPSHEQLFNVFWQEKMEDDTYADRVLLNIRIDGPRDNTSNFFDLDSDGDLDFTKATNEGLYWWENTNGKGQFSEPKLIDGISPTVIKTEDIDQDGDDDIAVGGEGYIYWYENQSPRFAKNPLTLTLPPTTAYTNQAIKIPINASGFENLTEISFTITWDAEAISFQEVEQTKFQNAETNQENGRLSISWTSSEGQTLAKDATLVELVFQLNGEEGSTTSVQFAEETTAKNTSGETVRVETTTSTVTILVNQAPIDITLSNNEVEENQGEGTLVGKLLTEDTDDSEGFSYTLAEGEGDEDNSAFQIVNTNELVTNISFDFEEKQQYSIRVQTTDPKSKSFQKALTIAILDVDENTNQAPTAIALSSTSVDENQDTGTEVGILSTTDEDEGDTHEYRLVEGEDSGDNELFFIKEDRLLTLEVFDFEEQEDYSVRIETEDQDGAKFARAFTITINDLEEPTNAVPTDILLSDQELLENVLPGTLVGTLSTVDADEDDEHTYALVDGEGDTGNEQFTIQDNRLLTLVSFDYETQPETSVRVRVNDEQGGTFEKSFTITIKDIADDENQPPVSLTLSGNNVDENQPSGTVVGTFSADDINDDNLTYTLVAGNGSTHNISFIIDGNQLQTAESFDYELRKRYSIRVQADDGRGGTVAEQFWIEVNDLDDALNSTPTAIRLSNQRIEENQAAGTIVGEFSTQDRDEDDQHTYTLVTGTRPNDNDQFYIQDNQLLSDAEFDYEEDQSFVVRVQTDDGKGGTFATSFLIEVLDVEENIAPLTGNPLSDQTTVVNEDFAFTIPANTFSDQNQNDSLSYTVTLANGEPLPTWLTFDPITLTLSGTPAKSEELTIRVTATDKQGESASDEIILTIEGVTSLIKEVDKNYLIYPNPSKKFLIVETLV
ncbi:MAG: FG-GAP-like repeat-containing protein [Cyclobacteriaceae bacterium]